LLLISAALAQAPPEPLLRVTVNVVQVQVVATDGNARGAHITNLKVGDFRLLQDGKKQKITHCTYIRNVRAAAPKPAPRGGAQPVEGPLPPVTLASEQVRRTIVVVVDDLDFGYATFQEFVGLRRALKKYVTDQIRPGDMVAILRTAGNFGALQQFTFDKPKLLAAVDGIGFFTRSGSGDSYELQRRLISMTQGLGTLPGQKSIVLFTMACSSAMPSKMDR
jgi:VWFA-related protein